MSTDTDDSGMALEVEGVSGHVSKVSDSPRIVEDRPDGPHVQVYHIPGDSSLDATPRQAHDVVVRSARDETGDWPVRESHGSFDGAAEAVEAAVDLGEEQELPIWDTIQRLGGQ